MSKYKIKPAMLLLCLGFLPGLCPFQVSYAQSAADADELYRRGETHFEQFFSGYAESDYQRALENYRQALSLYRQGSVISLKAGNCRSQLAILLQVYGKSDSALYLYREAVHIKKQLDNSADSVYFKDLVLAGSMHYYLDHFDSAEYYYRQAEAIARQYDDLYEKKRLYNAMGAYYARLGNYRQAINHYRKALRELKKNDPDYETERYILLNNIAMAQLKLGRYDEALRSFMAVADKSSRHDHIYFENIGQAYLGKSMPDSAVFYLQKSLRLNPERERSSVYNLLAELQLMSTDADSARYYFRKSLDDLAAAGRTERSINGARALLGLSQAFDMAGRPDSALQYVQRSLAANSFSFEETDYLQNPDSPADCLSPLLLYRTLMHKAALLRQEKTRQPQDFALQTYQKAAAAAAYIRKTYDNDEAKLFLASRAYPVYEKAVDLAYRLYDQYGDAAYMRAAYQLADQSRAAVLAEISRDVEIRSDLGLPDSLLQMEKQQKQQITRLRFQLSEENDTARVSAYRAALNDNEIQLARTIKALQAYTPYRQKKLSHDSLDISSLQAELDKRSALLEYFSTDSLLYVFVLDHERLHFIRLNKDEAYRQALGTTLDYFYGQLKEGSVRREAERLYQYLLAPLQDAIAGKERLIIVPGDELSYLPFEMLQPDADSNRYLLNNYLVSYAYSSGLLLQALGQEQDAGVEGILAMAPYTGQEQNNIRSSLLRPLFSSREEVEKIGGSIYTDRQATKRQFLRLAGSHQVLHLATHASIDSDQPLNSFIAFYPEEEDSISGYRLYTQELYNMRLDSVKLVVLSACEAGNGRLVKGEGVISLARAFAYAGCHNVLTTLWKAEDQATAFIATSVHEYLRQGYRKDEALRQAKLDYLAQDLHPVLKSPRYWANFIFIGDPSPIYQPTAWWLYVLAGSLALALVVFLLKKFFF